MTMKMAVTVFWHAGVKIGRWISTKSSASTVRAKTRECRVQTFQTSTFDHGLNVRLPIHILIPPASTTSHFVRRPAEIHWATVSMQACSQRESVRSDNPSPIGLINSLKFTLSLLLLMHMLYCNRCPTLLLGHS